MRWLPKRSRVLNVQMICSRLSCISTNSSWSISKLNLTNSKLNMSFKAQKMLSKYKKFFDLLMKQFLVEKTSATTKKPYREFEEQFLRESIRQFPYKECALLRQMVQILFKVEMGSSPTALYVITSCLNGQRFTEQDSDVESHKCAVCLERNAKLCSQCKRDAYCDQICQKLHWTAHKKECKPLQLSNNCFKLIPLTSLLSFKIFLNVFFGSYKFFYYY